MIENQTCCRRKVAYAHPKLPPQKNPQQVLRPLQTRPWRRQRSVSGSRRGVTGAKPILLKSLSLCIGIALSCTLSNAQTLHVNHLTVDLLQHTDLQVVNGYPIVGNTAHKGVQTLIANKQPVLGWELTSTQVGATQT